MSTATAEIVATRTTFDGVTVFLHADGQVSNRAYFYRGRLPRAVMFRVIDDVCLHAAVELPALIRSAKGGKYPRPQAAPKPHPYVCIRDGYVCTWKDFAVVGGVVRPV